MGANRITAISQCCNHPASTLSNDFCEINMQFGTAFHVDLPWVRGTKIYVAFISDPG